MEKIKTYLDQIGMSDYETRVYLCLLQSDHLTATELSKVTAIHPAKIYSVIHKLESKHFCERVPGNEKAYKAIKPSNPIHKQIGSLHNQIEQLTNIANVLDSYYQTYNKNNSLIDYIEVVKNKDLIIMRSEQLENQAKNHVLCLLKSPFISSAEAMINAPLSFVPGVKYISIYDEKELQNPDRIKVMRRFQKHGVEIRICKNIPVKIALFDGNTVLINTRDKISTTSTSTAIIVHHEDLVQAFSDLFEFYYNQSVPLADRIQP